MNDEKGLFTSAPTAPESASRTPPERQILLPLTPPTTNEWPSDSSPQSPVSAVLDLFRRRQRHELTASSRQLKLHRSEYQKLLKRLDDLPDLKGFVDDKVGWEYDPLREVFCLRMTTPIHESFSDHVASETKIQLARIAHGNDEAAKFAARISSVGSGRIRLQEFDSDDDIDISDQSFIQRQPDEQFQHEDAAYPGVVYEIAYSHDLRGLDKAAWTYIPYSNGDIKAVVGFELGYGKNKEARLSLWQPRYLKEGEGDVEILDVETVIDRDPFRSSDGSAINASKTLHLPLGCFATSEVANFHAGGMPGITISYTKLAQFLNSAERLQQMREPALGEESCGKKSSRHTKKRKRPSTPTEQLSSDREREFRDTENEVEKRTEVEDDDFPDQASPRIDMPEKRKSQRMR